jgi:hypothetical protein
VEQKGEGGGRIGSRTKLMMATALLKLFYDFLDDTNFHKRILLDWG